MEKVEKNFVCSFNTFLHCLSAQKARNNVNDETFLCLDDRFVNIASKVYECLSQLQADFDFPTICCWCPCNIAYAFDCFINTAQDDFDD